MADFVTLHEHAQNSVAPLKKIISSQGQNSGTFYFVKGNRNGESGVIVLLQKLDKKGTKALAIGKKLRKASGGKIFSVGTVKMEENKLVFRVKKGSAKATTVQKSFKNDFLAGNFSKVGALLKRAKVVDGDEAVEDLVVQNLDQEEALLHNQPAQSDTFTPAEMAQMQVDLRTELASADEKTKKELQAILDAEADLASDMVDIQDLYLQLHAEEMLQNNQLNASYVDDDGKNIVAVIEEMYRSDLYSVEEMKDYAKKIADKGVDLSVFENRASQGQKIPEPLRSQILLSSKIAQEQQTNREHQRNFPSNIKDIFTALTAKIQEQNQAIADDLKARNDNDMQAIGKYIRQGNLFESYPSDLQNLLKKITSATKTKEVQNFQAKLDAFNNFILVSPKIEACDTFVQVSEIRTLLVPKITLISKIISTLA